MSLLNSHRQSRSICAVAVLAALTVSACSGGKDAVAQDSTNGYRFKVANKKGSVIQVADRRQAGPVAGKLLSGGDYALTQDKGKIVVLNFFASWCGPCQNETPQFDSVYRQRKADGVQFIGLDVKDPSRSQAQSFIDDKDITFPVIYDEPAKTALQLGDIPVSTLPQTVIIDKQGRVAAVYFQVLAPKDLTNVIDQLSKDA